MLTTAAEKGQTLARKHALSLGSRALSLGDELSLGRSARSLGDVLSQPTRVNNKTILPIKYSLCLTCYA